MQSVTLGKHNPRLLDIRRAVEHGTLTADGLLPIEGPKLLEEAESSGLQIGAVFVRRGGTMPSLAGHIPVYEIDASTFKTIQTTETSQGVIALVRIGRFDLEEVLKRRRALIMMLARLQDPGNVGTILRVAESFGADACLATRGTAFRFQFENRARECRKHFPAAARMGSGLRRHFEGIKGRRYSSNRNRAVRS